MREVVLDTETTGFDPRTGDRLVEIGCIELINHVRTDKTYWQYINPERDVPEDAVRVHGLTYDFLKDKPVFGDVVDSFLEFIGDSPLVIHNAPFDMGFLNFQLGQEGRPLIAESRAVDTLFMARKRYPGAPASLDALCKRFDIDNTSRSLHGALLDSELLADVYLELMGGRQTGLGLDGLDPARSKTHKVAETSDITAALERNRPARPKRSFSASEAEKAAHAAFIAQMDMPIWAASSES